jgi:KaiC/GvpD/RAD55 family RecA-like ATPase
VATPDTVAPADGGLPPQRREPLWSRESEQSVLGSILQDGAALQEVGDMLADGDFFDAGHREIYRAARCLSAAGSAIDIVTMYEQLQNSGTLGSIGGGLTYVNQLAQCVPSARNIRQYAEIVRSKSLLRKLADAADQILSAAHAPGGRSVDELVTSAESLMSELMRERSRKLPGARIPMLPLEGLRKTSESVRWLCKGVVPSDSVGLLFGGSGTFKSFIALDLALHVAHGLSWLGRKTRQGPVIYIAAEGGAGLWSRIDAWHRARRLDPASAQLYAVTLPVDLVADGWRVVEAAEALHIRPALVVIDTMSQTFAGEENSANEVAGYLREISARFRGQWGCANAIVHHSGHMATERPRGSSALRANVDWMLGVFRSETEMLATMTSVKQKDGELFPDQTFHLQAVDLGEDEDGDQRSSLVARAVLSETEKTELVEHEARRGRSGHNPTILRLAQNGMPEKSLRSAFYDAVGLEESDARRQAYYRALSWAKKAGFLEIAGGVVILLREPKA